MAFFAPPSGGFNPRWGRDEGPAPPAIGRRTPLPPYTHTPAAGYAVPAVGYQYQYIPQQSVPPLNAYYYGAGAIPPQQPHQRGYTYISGFGGGTQMPQPHPIVNTELPAANMTNSTGGVGCEPGYNYFFAPEHTKIHVLKTGATPPWQLPPNFGCAFHACHVPVSTTVGELLKGFGATNPVAKKNKVWEVVQGGNGRWYKGLGFSGENKSDMERTLKALGWDSTRSGLPGQKPVVYLYITKD